MRQAQVQRTTQETNITLSLCIDGTGNSDIKSGVGFLDHMLTLWAKHGRMDLGLSCKGDVWVEDHHSVEDIAIVLGQAFAEALGEKRGICRYADRHLAMDEALVLCSVDLSGRGGYYGALEFPTEKIGSFDTQLVDEFMQAFAAHAKLTLHLRQICGKNSHHIAEACFKALGRVLREACTIDPSLAGEIPSTKGILS